MWDEMPAFVFTRRLEGIVKTRHMIDSPVFLGVLLSADDATQNFKELIERVWVMTPGGCHTIG